MSDNKNIENFIKKRLEDKDFSFEEEHWKQLEAKLDANEQAFVAPSSSGRITKTMLFVAGAIVIFFAGWFANNLSSDRNELKESAQEVSTLKISLEGKAENETLKPQEEEVSNRPLLSQQVDKEASKTGQSNYENEILANNNSGIKKLNKSESKSVITSNADKRTEKAEVTIGEKNQNNAQDIVYAHEVSKPLLISSSVGKASLLPLSTIEIVQTPILPYILIDTADSEKKKKAKPFSYTVDVFVAPDFNATSFNQLFDELGEMIGIDFQLEYKDRFRFGAGVIYNNKNYTAFGNEYSPPKGFWTNGIVPDNTEATCEALDIPISIGYKAFNLPKQKIWINAGVSSYWLLKENYSFIYNNPDPNLVQGWSGEQENFHLFGSLNFSFTYEQRLFQKLSLTVEPYYKIPLKGIGHGSVDLISGGVKLGILYRFKPPP